MRIKGIEPIRTSEAPQERLLREKGHQDNPENNEIERLVAKLDTLRNGGFKQVILVTSALPGEGKTTITSLLARSFARNRMAPTLLADFDLRRPRQHRVFNLMRGEGIVDMLYGTKFLRNCVKETPFPYLDLLTSGILKDNPIEVLNIHRIQAVVKEMKQQYDNIIIDSSPVFPISDPLLLGRLVDHVIMVVKAGETSKHVVKRAIDGFSDVKVEISGIILNNMKNVLPYYYDHDYSGYKYFETGGELQLE